MDSNSNDRRVSQVVLRVNSRTNKRKRVGSAATPRYIRLKQRSSHCSEMSIQRVEYNPDQIIMETRSKLKLQEPARERFHAIIRATNEISAERSDRIA